MKGTGMLVVSLKSVNFGFWSHLGCPGQNTIIFNLEGLVEGCTQRNIEIYLICRFGFIYSIHINYQSFV